MSDTTTRMTRDHGQSHRTRAHILIAAAVLVIAGLAVAAWALQPWKLVLDQTVDEAVPTSIAPDPAAGDEVGAQRAFGPSVVLTGSFISHEHDTQGSATVYELPDGELVLRLEDFRTSNGPDLKVWLTNSRVIDGSDGWFVFDDGRYVDLGSLKGNVGNQNYSLPSGIDLDDFRSVTIWCDRFNVSFGAAELTP